MRYANVDDVSCWNPISSFRSRASLFRASLAVAKCHIHAKPSCKLVYTELIIFTYFFWTGNVCEKKNKKRNLVKIVMYRRGHLNFYTLDFVQFLCRTQKVLIQTVSVKEWLSSFVFLLIIISFLFNERNTFIIQLKHTWTWLY